MANGTDWIKIVEKILSLDAKTRFAAILDLKGNMVEGIMKGGKTSLESQREQEHFCAQVALRRKMRKEFDKTLGKVNYVHIERENVTQIVVYTKTKTIFVTVEPTLGIENKLKIIRRIKQIASRL